MSTRIRVEEPGAFYHVNANALDGMDLYRDDVDRARFFEMFAEEIERSEWTILEYTLMTTHYHVLLQLKKCTLSSGFQRLQSRYARSYNTRHRRRGVVWQSRFHDAMVTSDRHLFETVRYLALNAPRAGMVGAAEDWPWCSYGAAIGSYETDPLVDEPALLGLFSPTTHGARTNLRAFVEEADPRIRWGQKRPASASRAQSRNDLVVHQPVR
jgi:REP element-mobilizing transposase RayT